MLTTISIPAVRKMTLGARDHATLLSSCPDLCREVLEDGDWTCHVCGSRVPDGMEIDHLSGHVSCKKKHLKPICQFCHNLKHPLWAAARGRIVPIIAPDVSQIDLHRLSWAMIAWRSEDEFASECEAVRKALLERHEIFCTKIGCTTAEALFEAILTEIRSLGEDLSSKGILQMDAMVRMIPQEVLIEAGDIDSPTAFQKASRLSTWTIGGFRKIAISVSNSLRKDISDREVGTP